jgi:hypothetical protein
MGQSLQSGRQKKDVEATAKPSERSTPAAFTEPGDGKGQAESGSHGPWQFGGARPIGEYRTPQTNEDEDS